MTAPLCDAGRCASLLEAFAKQRDQAADRLALRAEQILVGALGELGIDATDHAVRAAVAASCSRLVGQGGVAGEGDR